MNSIDEVVDAVRQGELVVVIDDEDRENEGDLVMAAELATPEAINFMVVQGRGLICVPLTGARARELELCEMAPTEDRFNTAFTVSVDARHGISTGISAHDRSATIQLLADPAATRSQLDVPGHIFPLIARGGGVLERPGHTEAAVELARLAGCSPVGVICEIMNDDGTMARTPDLEAFAARHQLKICTIHALVQYLQKEATLIEATGSVRIPVRYAPEDFELFCYLSKIDGKEHLAMVYGDVAGVDDVLVRVHSECLTGDVFHSARCDCGEQLELALKRIVEAGRGVLVYLRQEGRGIGLVNKIQAYGLQDTAGLDTVDANLRLGFLPDQREYSVAARILQSLEVGSVRLLTNNPKKLAGLEEFGIQVVERLPITVPPRADNEFYLQTKKKRLGHWL